MAAPIITAYLINESWLKSYTALNANLDSSLIVPYIRTAQDLWIQPKIGSAQYSRLMEGIVNNDLTADENLLLEMIRPSLAWYTAYEATPHIFLNLRNAGVVKVSNANVENVGLEEMDYLRREFQNKAEFYMQRCLKFLCEESASYPLVKNTEDMQSDSSIPYRSGIAISGRCTPRTPWLRQ